jgi:hypothetical protein
VIAAVRLIAVFAFPQRCLSENRRYALKQLRAAGVAKVCRETASGACIDRVQLRRVIGQITDSHVLMVTRLDRLAVHLIQTVAFENLNLRPPSSILPVNPPAQFTVNESPVSWPKPSGWPLHSLRNRRLVPVWTIEGLRSRGVQ